MHFNLKNIGKLFIRNKTALTEFLIVIVLISIAAIIWGLRYQPAFHLPNFYAEDGPAYVNNVLHKNIILSAITSFNGYLIVGEYLLTDIAVGIYKILGLHFYQLPQVIAAVSCLFMGLTVTLPYILFKKQLGRVLAIAAVATGAFVPMPTYDYAIIGTMGNLKFVFLYWATLLIIYRCIHPTNLKKTITIDALLLLCLLTNVLVVFLLPFILIPYRSALVESVKRKKVKSLFPRELISWYILMLIAFVYLVLVYVKGIPKLPGYLDSPYAWRATPKIAYKVTIYTWLYPVTSTMRDALTGALILLFGYYGFSKRKNRLVALVGFWAIFVGTAGFVFNRPGVSEWFLAYGPTPDQFFYTQDLIFIFVTVWMLRSLMAGANARRSISFVAIIILFLWWSAPYGSSYGSNKVIYENLGTAKYNLQARCKLPYDNINFQVYPESRWNWTLSKDIACK